MSHSRCPFVLDRKIKDEDEVKQKTKDDHVQFTILLIPGQEDGPKCELSVKKLRSCDPEDALIWVQQLLKLFVTMDIPEGVAEYRTARVLLDGDPLRNWNSAVANTEEDDHDKFEEAIDELICCYVDRTIALDTKEWLRRVKKPMTWTVHELASRIRHINALIDVMPTPVIGGDQVPALSDDELAAILRTACPVAWSGFQELANLSNLDFTAQTNYLEGVRHLENSGNNNIVARMSRRRNTRNNDSNDRRNNNNNRRNSNQNRRNNNNNDDNRSVSSNNNRRRFRNYNNTRQHQNNSNNNNNYITPTNRNRNHNNDPSNSNNRNTNHNNNNTTQSGARRRLDFADENNNINTHSSRHHPRNTDDNTVTTYESIDEIDQIDDVF